MKLNAFCSVIICVIMLPLTLMGQPPMTAVPKIDGIISPDEWSGAVKYNNFIPVEAGKARAGKATTAYFGYDRDNLYVAFDCQESDSKNIKAGITDRDGTVWFDDGVEIFIKTALNHPEYYHFIINARGTVMDQLCRPQEVGAHKDWNAFEMENAVGRSEHGWQAEIKIPLKNFYLSGREWSFNLARNSQLPSAEFSSVKGMKGGFHRPDEFMIFQHELNAQNYSPGIEIIGVGERQIGKNIAKLKIINDAGKTGVITIKIKVTSSAGKSSELLSEISLDGKTEQIIEVPYEVIISGKTEMRVEILEQSKCVFSVSRSMNTRERSNATAEVSNSSRIRIDPDLALSVDGRKVFPLIFFRAPVGLYAELKKYGFNCAEVTNYRNNDEIFTAYLKAAANAGIGLLPNDDYAARRFLPGRLKKVVEKFKDAPSLWAWYLADEPQNYGITPENAVDLYHTIKKVDSTHPVFLLNSEPKLFSDYAQACDIFGIDCYPVPKQPLKIIADYIESAHKAVKNVKPVWLAVQTFGSFKYGGRIPTKAEVRCMIYLAVAHRVKGLLFFAYTSEEMGGALVDKDADFYQEVLKIGKEINQLSEALTASEIPQNYQVHEDNGKLHCRMIASHNNVFLIAVNPYQENVKAKFVITALSKTEKVVLWPEGTVSTDVQDRSWNESFDAYDVKIYQIKK